MQVYDLSNQFLPKEWIMEKWEEGFYITAMAGSASGSSLVVMSKGTPYTQQSYKARVRHQLSQRHCIFHISISCHSVSGSTNSLSCLPLLCVPIGVLSAA